MALIRWQPRKPIGTVQDWSPFRDLDLFGEEMSRLLDATLGIRTTGELLDRGWVPPVDVVQEGDRYRVQVDLPGMKREEITITIDGGNTLTIQGEKKRESRQESEDHLREERRHGGFSRSIVLPSSIDPDRIEASYKDGVLDIVIPKHQAALPRQIEIES